MIMLYSYLTNTEDKSVYENFLFYFVGIERPTLKYSRDCSKSIIIRNILVLEFLKAPVSLLLVEIKLSVYLTIT